MSNETKVGILAVVSIVLFIFGYNFLKGLNMLSNSTILYASYENVNSLTVSTPIFINGLQVGVVKDIYFKDDLQTIEVEMNIEDDYRIPKDAEAVIASTSLMGGVALHLRYKSVCAGADCAQSGDHIKGRLASVMETVVGDTGEVKEYLKEVQKGVGPIMDSLKASVSDPNSDDAISKSVRDISVVLENLKASTANLNRMVLSSRQPMNGILANAQSLTGSLDQRSRDIKGILVNTDSLTNKLNNLQIEATLASTNEAIASLKNTMTSADKAVGQLTSLLEKINSGEGAVGKLLNDDSSLTSLLSAAERADTLFKDIRERPYRYMPIKSRRKVKKYDRQDGKN